MSKFLKEKVIKDIKIADDKKALLFICEDGEHVVKVDGDCCSDSWVESVELPALGFPCKVIDCLDLDLDLIQEEYDENLECVAFYGYKIITNKGEIVIDYRNASNGYYGGNLSWPDEDYFYGGVYGQNCSDENWTDVKE